MAKPVSFCLFRFVPHTYFFCAEAPPFWPSERGLNRGGGSRIFLASRDRTRTTREWIAADTTPEQLVSFRTAPCNGTHVLRLRVKADLGELSLYMEAPTV